MDAVGYLLQDHARMRRVSENLHDHFNYEEKNLFPRIREIASTPLAAGALKDA